MTTSRAIDDPVVLARVARIVRAALARRRLADELAELIRTPAIRREARAA